MYKKKIKVGIFLGGRSREKEISFAGGRTVYDNLDKNIFEPIPIFIDSIGNFILLHWQYLYQGTIRDFYPTPTEKEKYSVYVNALNSQYVNIEAIIKKVGKKITPEQFSSYFDTAFLVLHGKYGEDGTIQAMLEWYQIPYTGVGILGSSLGINKKIQNEWMKKNHFCVTKKWFLYEEEWHTTSDYQQLLSDIIEKIGLPFIVKSNTQGSSIGISVIHTRCLNTFIQAVEKSFFYYKLKPLVWQEYTEDEKKEWVQSLLDPRKSIGFPVYTQKKIIYHPEELIVYLNYYCNHNQDPIILKSIYKESEVLCETYLAGREFSCIVITDNKGYPIALPPTEIIQENIFFDYRAKYMPGLVRKQTPMRIDYTTIQNIREICVSLFRTLHFNVWARIDGIVTDNKCIYLIDPNTTSGMMPSSFLFHQAAHIGLNPTAFLNLIIYNSLKTRKKEYIYQKKIPQLIKRIDSHIQCSQTDDIKKIKVGILIGGFSAEKHISLESGRNVYQKLASSTKYIPIPILLSGSEKEHQLFILPIHLLLKDHADDIHQQVQAQNQKNSEKSILSAIQQEAKSITQKYTAHFIERPQRITYKQLKYWVQFMFIALHGRPGEDGTIQQILSKENIPYNGSDQATSFICMDKYKTNQLLKTQGIKVAEQLCIEKKQWKKDGQKCISKIEKKFSYPYIVKPIDEGCSAGVICINTQEQLITYIKSTFELPKIDAKTYRSILHMPENTYLPCKKSILIEEMITKGKAQNLLEITGGLLTPIKTDDKKSITYEILPPSETLANHTILSLEEKFLAGEGQNITPARFHTNKTINKKIQVQVQQTFKRVAQILNIQGYARIDAFVKINTAEDVDIFIIEVNTLPALTPATCIFHQCALQGYKPYEFLDKIIQYGLKHKKR